MVYPLLPRGGASSALGDRPPENHILLRPRMHLATVRAGEFLCFNFGRSPPLFDDCLSGIGEF